MFLYPSRQVRRPPAENVSACDHWTRIDAICFDLLPREGLDMATLTVGFGEQFSTIAAAVAASVDGDVVEVAAGTYTNDFSEITTRITIEGVGGMVPIVATDPPPNGKAILTTDTDVTLINFELSGAAVSEGN